MKPSISGYLALSSSACLRFLMSPLMINLVSGEIAFLSLIISGISSKWAETLLISFLVRR